MTEIRTGVKVLIPGTIREALGPGMATVETAAGIHVERTDDLVIDGPRSVRALSSPEERVERLARVMALADDVNPNERASITAPLARAGGFLTGDEHFSAWRLYAKYARALIDEGLA